MEDFYTLSEFICWTLTGDGRKLPISPYTGEVCDVTSQQHWATYKDAVAAAQLFGAYGVAIIMHKNSRYKVIDVDKCYDPPTNKLNAVGGDIYQLMRSALKEYSVSGNGMHLFFRMETEIPHRCKNTEAKVEYYTEARMICLTEKWIGDGGDPNWVADEVMRDQVIPKYFDNRPGLDDGDPIAWVDEAVPEWHGADDDDQLIEKMVNSRPSAGAMFGADVTFRQLWENDQMALARKWPPIGQGKPYDQSSADQSLANRLAFWTGKNPVRMRRLMERSGLVRDKWTKHRGYMRSTITRAINHQDAVYTNGNQAAVAGQMGAQIQFGGLIGAQQLSEFFHGNVYIASMHRIWNTSTGKLLKPEAFRVMYGGHTFVLTADGSKTTRNAWEAFSENQMVRFPRVYSTVFRPEHPPGELVEINGDLTVNLYVPIETPKKRGDPTRFLQFLRKLVRTDHEYRILLYYMAAIVQYKGSKFQWMLILQGLEGNGKTTIARILTFCLGMRNVHIMSAGNLADGGLKFNAWIASHLLAVLEEMHTNDRRDLADGLKPLISNDFVEIQAKGMDQYTGDNRCNFLGFTNYEDAVQTHAGDRRYCVIRCPQQRAGDLERDGLTTQYFNEHYDWLNDEGFAIINWHLSSVEIPPEYDPTKEAIRAPHSSTQMDTIRMTMGPVEQEILEAVEQEMPGFKGGWISSLAVDKLLKERGLSRRISRGKITLMLEKMGWVKHPRLTDGRASQVIMQEGGRPRLYVPADHPSVEVVQPGVVTDQYILAQGYIN